MKVTIEPGQVNGIITAPSSKSTTQRAYAAALLHNGVTTIYNAGISEDENAALQVIRQLGAKITSHPDRSMVVTSTGLDPVSAAIPCGESGLAARLFTPIASLLAQPIAIEGTGTLLLRPMEGFKEVLPLLNVSLVGFNGYLPFSVHGPLVAKDIEVDAQQGSQFLSGLLFAFCSAATGPVTIKVSDLKSRPYIDMTIEVLAKFGKPVTHLNYKEFHIDPAGFTHEPDVEISVEGDWSSAAYFLVAGAIAGDVTVRSLRADSIQADTAILQVLKQASAKIVEGESSLTVSKSRLTEFDFDATHCPDLFPVLAILGACCDGESCIRGVHRLFDKESNRVESITQMLQDFAVPYSVEDDSLFITGVQKLQGTIIDSYHDHRIVMAAAIGALRASGPVGIDFAESVNKSYPGFFNDLKLIHPGPESVILL